jgi:thiol-disulfide isomerase/thioredoxin
MKDQLILGNYLGQISLLKQSLCRPISGFLLATLITALPAGAEDYRYHVGDITRAQLFEAYPTFQAQYDDYEVGGLSSVMVAELRIEVLFATWCHDSEREVPRLLKILETAGVESSAVELVALDFNKTEPKGRAALQGLEYTPTFVFSVAGEEIGRIVERPDKSLEAALANIVRNAR